MKSSSIPVHGNLEVVIIYELTNRVGPKSAIFNHFDTRVRIDVTSGIRYCRHRNDRSPIVKEFGMLKAIGKTSAVVAGATMLGFVALSPASASEEVIHGPYDDKLTCQYSAAAVGKGECEVHDDGQWWMHETRS